MPDQLYLVSMNGEDEDPTHLLFDNSDKALARAQVLSDNAAAHYEDNYEVIKPAGRWLFCRQGDCSWHVVVEKITLQD